MSIVSAAPHPLLLALLFAGLALPERSAHAQVAPEAPEAVPPVAVAPKPPDAPQAVEAPAAEASPVSEVIVMEGKLERSSEGVQLMLRKNAPAVSDVLSKQEIARTPDSSASDAVKRVPSVTVDEGKYVVIRGLGDRYVSTLLNGASLPSPEPDRQAVPLDLFPTSLLSNLTVAKSYTANLPGTFAGGGLLLNTNAYPVDFEVEVKVSTGLDSTTALRDVNTLPGGSLDFLGYDDGARDTPTGLPQDSRMDELSPAERERLGGSMANRWAAGTDTALLDLGIGAEVGDTVRVGGKRLGYLGTFTLGPAQK